jgi:hypothetical protein
MEITDRKLRMPEPLRATIEARAKTNGVSMNAEMIDLFEAALEHESDAAARDRTLAEAVFLAYGPNNGALLHLIGEVLNIVDRRGQWRDDPSQNETILRGVVRLLRRLQAPDDVHVFQDDSVEGQVDTLLWDLGNDGRDHPGPLMHVHRWSAQIRRRLGDIGPLLVKMRRTVREHQQGLRPIERQLDDPGAEVAPGLTRAEVDAMWQASLAKARVSLAEQLARQAEAAREEGNARRRQRKGEE